MHPSPVLQTTLHKRFPRARGDAPSLGKQVFAYEKFSPRARGCTLPPPQIRPMGGVFPARAGMHLMPFAIASLVTCFPRARGDAPVATSLVLNLSAFSPRARGCTRRAVS